MGKQMFDFEPEAAAKIRNREPLRHTWVNSYVTRGGTYVLASPPQANDDDRPHDLVAILPSDLGSGRVIPLRVNVGPELVRAVCRALDVMR